MAGQPGFSHQKTKARRRIAAAPISRRVQGSVSERLTIRPLPYEPERNGTGGTHRTVSLQPREIRLKLRPRIVRVWRGRRLSWSSDGPVCKDPRARAANVPVIRRLSAVTGPGADRCGGRQFRRIAERIGIPAGHLVAVRRWWARCRPLWGAAVPQDRREEMETASRRLS